MKVYIWGILGTIVAFLSLAIQFVKAIRTIKKEKDDKLDLKVCDEIAYYNGVYQVKIINISSNATACNLQVSLRIKNNHFNRVYKIQDVVIPVSIYSVNKDRDKEACEVLVNVDAMRIRNDDIETNASKGIKELFEEKKLELNHLLSDKELYLAVRVNAVNKTTGKTKDFPKKVFYYKDVKQGKFGVGDDYVTRIN